MRPTLLQYSAAWIPAIPALIGLLAWRRLGSAPRWIVAWCAVLLVRNALSAVLAARGINNHWVYYSFLPVLTALGLWALSHWHDGRPRSALRYAIVPAIVVSVLLIAVFDDRRSFSLVASPIHHLALLVVSLSAFVRLSLTAEGSLGRQAWFWILGGFILTSAASTAIGPTAWYLLGTRIDLLHVMLNVGAAAEVAAFTAMAWGMTWPILHGYSGGSFSPPSLPSSFSSADSGSPWRGRSGA